MRETNSRDFDMSFPEISRCSCEICSDVTCQHDGSSCLSPEGDVHCGYESCCNGPFGEYIDVSSRGDAGISFELCTLCRLDDFEHYSRCAFVDYGFALYDDAILRRGAWSLMRRFDDSTCFKPVGCSSDFSCSFLDIRAVKSTCDIILDSGSDATVIPVSMIAAGNASQDQTSYLRDAQGARIETEGVRDVSIILTTVDGVDITIRDKAHVSSRVDCPLISYGKLLRHGWGIVPEGDKSYLVHSSGVKVDISFKQNSLVVAGVVRMVSEAVRVIDVDIPKRWQDLKNGWYRTKDNTPLCASHGRNFVDCLKHYTISDWPYRTTVGYRDGVGWQVIELCQSVFQLDDRAAPISGGYSKLLTMLSKQIVSIVDFGMAMTNISPVQPSKPRASVPSMSDSPMTGGDGALHGLGGAQQLTGVAASATTSDGRHDPVRDVGTFHRATPAVSERPDIPTIPTSIAIEATSDRLEIAGVVVVTKTSSISVLKAACEYLAVSQSGSKAKLWNRIIATVDRQRILEETQLSVPALTGDSTQPRPVQLAERPGEDEVQRHMLTHSPYAAWCEACVSSKGKPDRHERDETRVRDREIPVLSFDFAFTGKSLDDAQDEDEGAKLTTLVLHDSHSGSVNCIPLKAKSDSKHAVREMVKYLQYLGHGDICLMCDQEPSALAVQSLLQRTWQRMGFRVVIENAKVLDHGGNAWAEKSIDRIRTTAGVLIQQLQMNIGHEIPAKHPLFSWAFCHAAWIIDRFVSKANVTAYELVRGHSYRGKLCQFGEPLMCYVADTTKRKGDARWRPGVFLGKSVTNDMFLVHCDANVRLTRSVKSIYKDWSEHMGLYRTLVVQPWQIEGTLGNRIDPISSNVAPEAVPALDDEAGTDPPDPDRVAVPETSDLVPMAGFQKAMKTPPLFASVAGPVTPVVASSHAGSQAEREPEAMVQDSVPMDESGNTRDAEQHSSEVDEPAAKRQKLTTRRIGGDELFHMDSEPYENFDGLDMGDVDEHYYDILYNDDNSNDLEDDVQYDASTMMPSSSNEVSVWQPYRGSEPEISQDVLVMIDEKADKIEIQRLLEMGVITTVDKYEGELDVALSAKMVRTWRKKTKVEVGQDGVSRSYPAWMRRSRLVGRDFNFLSYREDVYSPASSSSVVKLLPSMALLDGFIKDAVLATLDVSDAFLQVPQPVPRKVSLDGQDFIILKCLPGQRDASRLWYSFFVQRLSSHFEVSVCPEQPCILRCKDKGVLLLHVDDVLICGDEQWISGELIPKLESEFKLTYTVVKRQEGGCLDFLKRVHIIEPNYESITVFSENKHATLLIERYSEIEAKIPRMAFTPLSGFLPSSSPDSELLSATLAAEYRSLVGTAMYLAQERYDLQYTTKTLASCLQNPTKAAWILLGRLVGYLRFSGEFGLKMTKTKKGSTFAGASLGFCEEKERNQLEVYRDSDWSGGGDMKSTSSAVHTMNGIIVHSTSRSQKCISLSSTEAEWYAASSSVCDGYYLHHIVEFITDGCCDTLVLHTDNSAVRMLSLKFGVGRLRHIRGRMLWLQQKMSLHELVIHQVPTLENVADLNTKGHGKHRFLCLLYMFGFVTPKGARVGEDEFAKFQAKQATKQHVKLIGQILKDDVGEHVSSVSSVNTTAKRVLRVLSTYSLLQLASSHDELSPISTPGALGQSSMPIWHSWLQTMVILACGAVGLAFLVVVGAIKFRAGMRENEVAAEPVVEQVEVHDEVDGETDSQLRQRYLDADMGEVSDPELWHRLRYGTGDSSSESEISLTSQPHEPFAANFIEAIDATRDEVGNVAICSYLLSRCNRRFQEAGDEETRRHYSDAINSLRNSFGRFEAGELSDTSNDLRDILREFARMSPRASSPTSSLSVAQIAGELRRYEWQRQDVDMEGIDEIDGRTHRR